MTPSASRPKACRSNDGPGIEWIVAAVGNRNDELRVGVWKMHARGHDADDAARDAVDADRAAEDRRLAAEVLPPVAVAEHDVVILPGNCVVGREEIAERGMNTERVEARSP